ncbi:hypothetical protein AJ80_01510 [Polytolypa hystricis UAMH7299]|uniref:DUF7730 domain-containing protein n=1 Tax=Polytolypa hystricis (strain UAMH7299) TaxID=1447883 RepID=A0A2B7YYI2_POLH7|nr:hypothetical protein AJ80_01510 [Polytolypa hystricis UAMH7299]
MATQSQEQLPDPPMPILPMERGHRRPLTATPCLPSATANSNLFQRIPLGLRLLPPLKKHPPKAPANRPHAMNRPRHANIQDATLYDYSKPRQWQWCSSVYHDLWPDSDPTEAEYSFLHQMDHCYLGSASCDRWPGEMPAKCFIGALGWFLTCRQAYIEGVEVLYGTNRICISGTYLLHRLPDLMLPQRLATIRSVQLYWNIHPWVDSPKYGMKKEYQPGSDMEGFVSLLTALPLTLPNLTFLYLSLRGEFRFPIQDVGMTLEELDEITLNTSERLLQLVDPMVIQLRLLSYCQVLLPVFYFRARKFKEKGMGLHPDDVMSE